MNSEIEDSLKVEENEDGTFAVSWDQNDPKWSFLNTKTEAEINEWFNDAIRKLCEEYDSKWTIPVEEDPITGELYITFPPEAIQKTGWKDDDTLEWIDNKDGSFTLRKV
jgi:hypothetical protein